MFKQSPYIRNPDPEAIERLRARQSARLEREAMQSMLRHDTAQAGRAALSKLVQVAKGDTGQAETCRRLLLSLYNGRVFPLQMNELRGLDPELVDCMLAVIKADATYAFDAEIHHECREVELFKQWTLMQR